MDNPVHIIFLGGAPLFALLLIGIFIYLNRNRFREANQREHTKHYTIAFEHDDTALKMIEQQAKAEGVTVEALIKDRVTREITTIH
ncbi:MAG: hypothetical protein LAT53_07315 [Idiomarina sp.]|nr:hypothetical protein [Idiomarina sp.]